MNEIPNHGVVWELIYIQLELQLNFTMFPGAQAPFKFSIDLFSASLKPVSGGGCLRWYELVLIKTLNLDWCYLRSIIFIINLAVDKIDICRDLNLFLIYSEADSGPRSSSCVAFVTGWFPDWYRS
jgi:hypothetical protein